MAVAVKNHFDHALGSEDGFARSPIRTFVVGYRADGAREVAEFAISVTAEQITLGWHHEQALALARRLGYRSCVAFDDLDPHGAHRHVLPQVRRSLGIASPGVEVLIRSIQDQAHLDLEIEADLGLARDEARMRG